MRFWSGHKWYQELFKTFPDKKKFPVMVHESKIWSQLNAEFVNRGYRGGIVSVENLTNLHERIELFNRKSQFDTDFVQNRLSVFQYNPPETLPKPRSLIIVAVPRPQTLAIFNWQGRKISLIIPPTYTDYRKIAQAILDMVTGYLEPANYHAAPSLLPLKTLAVHSGLAVYGRNNICYVPGMGSFLELVGLYSTLPCSEDTWQEARMMETCHNCRSCLRHCPTGAVSEERFLLHAERCLVFHNEQPGNIPFPSWIDRTWHNCLEGCMLCQNACPENRKFVGWTDVTEEFTEHETLLLSQNPSEDRLPKETFDKLSKLDLLNDLGIIPRNLGVFLRTE